MSHLACAVNALILFGALMLAVVVLTAMSLSFVVVKEGGGGEEDKLR